jgi:hypothetical protein
MGPQSHATEYRGCSTAGPFSGRRRRINLVKSFNFHKMHSHCSDSWLAFAE